MDALLNRMRIEALRAQASHAEPMMGEITSYDPVQYAVKVKLKPEGDFPEQSGDVLETDWIPLSSHAVGNGWGLFHGPSIGDQVHVKFTEGSLGAGVIDGRVFDLTNLPLPTDTNKKGVPSGDMWMVDPNQNRITFSKTGDSFTLKHHLGSAVVVDGTANSGNDAITLTHHAGATLVLDKNGNVNVKPKSGAQIVLAGGGPKVARIGDTVVCPAGTGTITSGSPNVNSG